MKNLENGSLSQLAFINSSLHMLDSNPNLRERVTLQIKPSPTPQMLASGKFVHYNLDL
jgi:hypothetical protein